MTYAHSTFDSDPDSLPRMPPWVTSARAETLEDVAFLSGAALSHLHVVLGREAVCQALFWERLALRAAEACIVLSGRPDRAGELRDAMQSCALATCRVLPEQDLMEDAGLGGGS